MLNDALELFEIGLSVIPIVQETKCPPDGCTWKEQQDILPDEKTVVERFTNNPGCDIGIITGKASGVVVIDADSAEGCRWIEKTFPHTWLTVSNNGRGRHYYYRYPNDNIIKTSSGILYPGVDVRGDKGLVVVPPSTHKSGNKYVWNIAEGFSLEDIKDSLPECPVDIPGILGTTYCGKDDDNDDAYVPGELKNIAKQCEWMRHCRADAEELGYDEWRWMLSIVSRCVDGRSKAHRESALSSKYNFDNCDKKISEVLSNMGAATCRSISGKFDNCFKCSNLGRGLNFSPVILGAEDVFEEKVEILTGKDLKQETLCLQIPDKILNTGGLIGEGLSYLDERGLPDVPQLNLPAVLTILANAVSTKICYNKVYCNLFTLKIGRTSIGKSRADSELLSVININDKLKERFHFINELASGAALYKALEANSHLLCSIDEGTGLFKRYKVPVPAQEEKKETLMTLTSNSGQPFIKRYADSKKDIKLDNHCLSVLVNATPVIFDNLQYEDFETGLFQRIDVWCYEGDTPKWGSGILDGPNAKLFVKHLSELVASCKGKAATVGEALNLPHAVDGTRAFLKLKEEWSEENRIEANKYNEDSIRGIILRRFDASVKFALIHAGATRSPDKLYQPLDVDDLEWGICLTKCLSGWKQKQLLQRVTTGSFDADIEYFKRAVKKAMQIKRKPTIKYMMNRNKKMKNWGEKYFGEIINMIKKRDEITTDDSGKNTAYYLIKQ